MLVDNKLHSVLSVTALEDYFLLIVFDDNEKRLKDMKPHIIRGMFEPLQDKNLLNAFMWKIIC